MIVATPMRYDFGLDLKTTENERTTLQSRY
jgi:hypothetical protein